MHMNSGVTCTYLFYAKDGCTLSLNIYIHCCRLNSFFSRLTRTFISRYRAELLLFLVSRLRRALGVEPGEIQKGARHAPLLHLFPTDLISVISPHRGRLVSSPWFFLTLTAQIQGSRGVLESLVEFGLRNGDICSVEWWKRGFWGTGIPQLCLLPNTRWDLVSWDRHSHSPFPTSLPSSLQTTW